MMSRFGNLKYAFAFVLVILAANLLVAQDVLKQHVDNPGQTPMDQRATGHNPEAIPEMIDRAKPGPAVVTGNGIN